VKDLETNDNCDRDDEPSHVFSISDETKSDVLPHQGNEYPTRHKWAYITTTLPSQAKWSILHSNREYVNEWKRRKKSVNNNNNG